MSAYKHKDTQTATFALAESPNCGLVYTHTHTPAHTLAARAEQLGVRTGALAPPTHGRNNCHKVKVLTVRIGRINTPTLL